MLAQVCRAGLQEAGKTDSRDPSCVRRKPLTRALPAPSFFLWKWVLAVSGHSTLIFMCVFLCGAEGGTRCLTCAS